MVDNRMRFTIDQNMQFPLVEIDLEHGGSVYLQQGSMVYHTENVTLNTKLNGKGSGLGKLVGAIGRSMVSGESMFITQAMRLLCFKSCLNGVITKNRHQQ